MSFDWQLTDPRDEELGPLLAECSFCGDIVSDTEQCACDIEDEEPTYRYIDNLAPATAGVLVIAGVVVFGLLWHSVERLVRWL